MPKNLYGFVPSNNIIDLSALDKKENITNAELKNILLNITNIINQITQTINERQKAFEGIKKNQLLIGNENGYPTSLAQLSDGYFLTGSSPYSDPPYRQVEIAGGYKIATVWIGNTLTINYVPF